MSFQNQRSTRTESVIARGFPGAAQSNSLNASQITLPLTTSGRSADNLREPLLPSSCVDEVGGKRHLVCVPDPEGKNIRVRGKAAHHPEPDLEAPTAREAEPLAPKDVAKTNK